MPAWNPKKRKPVAEAGFRREDFTEERIEQIQRSMDLPPGFEILDRKTREASRAASLAEVQNGQGIWVFGYGSLMWNQAFHFSERVPG